MKTSFWNLNSLIFGRPKETARKTGNILLILMSNYKSGVIQPLVDNNWSY